MITDHTTIFVINWVCISLMVVMALILALATKLKNGAAYAALIVWMPSVPAYLHNMCRSTGMYEQAIPLIYFSNLTNTFTMPLLWLFVKSQIDGFFKFKPKMLLHFLPGLVSLGSMVVYYWGMPYHIRVQYIIEETNGAEHLPQLIDDVIVFGQMFIYYPIILRYLYKAKKQFLNNYSDSGYLNTLWIFRFMICLASLCAVVFVAYAIEPRTDVWLIPIANTLVMIYLVYNCITHPSVAYINRTSLSVQDNKHEQTSKISSQSLAQAQMEEYCNRIINYLKETQAYKNPDFSLSMLETATGISRKNISYSINTHLQKNFFELINQMRIEEAKRLLQLPDAKHYTIDSVYVECGFRSRSTFFLAFKKAENVSPAQWLSQLKIESKNR